jgi:hypothetical protein
MSYLITGALIGVCFFFVPLWSYRRGLKDGLAIQQGKPIEPIKTPIQAVNEYKEVKEQKKEQSIFNEGLNNLMTYDGESQEVKHES